LIKAIFFDWFNTLACYNPPREELYRRAFQEIGINLSFPEIYKGLLAGDRYFFAESNKALVRGKNFDERAKEFMRYPEAIASEVGLNLSPEIHLQIIRRVLRDFTNTFILFEDVLPLMSLLKNKKFITGIITNADEKITALVETLGLKPSIDFIITSQKTGAEKPSPIIFLAALEQARVKNSEAIYIGDQYQSDILGARGVGMQAILIDRYEINPEIKDCPRIKGLDEVIQYF
jgi:HAD superfamily hydrolase (TIGR01549 family)